MTRSGFREREMAAFFALRPHLRNLFSLVYAPQKARRNRLSDALKVCGLTEREGEVVILLCDRLSAGEIAERLKISRRTVEKHIEHVYLRLRVHNRKGLSEETILGNALGKVTSSS
jgi:DNA-binding CsgD family transcriptional regulator